MMMGGSDEEKFDHPTQKPADCMARPIRTTAATCTTRSLGSGTTIIAAERLGRRCYGLEIEPRYVQVASSAGRGSPGERRSSSMAELTFDHLALVVGPKSLNRIKQAIADGQVGRRSSPSSSLSSEWVTRPGERGDPDRRARCDAHRLHRERRLSFRGRTGGKARIQ